MIQLLNDDFYHAVKDVDDESIDCIITDPPYNVLASNWDVKLDFPSLWAEFLRITKPNAAICIFASGLFVESILKNSPKNIYKFKFVWVKNTVTNFIQAHHRPMCKHEDILIFSKASITNGAKINMNYFPQGLIKMTKKVRRVDRLSSKTQNTVLHDGSYRYTKADSFKEFTNFPNDILFFDAVPTNKKIHTSQKPIPLLNYLIRTFSKENDIVLDPFAGSASTAIACLDSNRNFLGFEIDDKIFKIASQRINEQNLSLFAGV